MTQVVQVVWVVQVVRVARTTSLDDMHSENIWFSWYEPSKYRKKLICHACDGGGRTDGKWKIGQCSVGLETAIGPFWQVVAIEYMTNDRYWAILAGGGQKIRKLGVFVKSTTQRMIMIGGIDRI